MQILKKILTAVFVIVGMIFVPLVALRFRYRLERFPVFGETQDQHEVEAAGYAAIINAAAVQHEFSCHGTRNISGLDGFTTAWTSPGNDVIALVMKLQAGNRSYQATRLFSKISDDTWFRSEDIPGPVDPTGLVSVRELQNANFDELFIFHMARQEDGSPYCRLTDSPWVEIENLMKAQAKRKVESGYGKFVDSEELNFQHTWQGALRMAVTTVLDVSKKLSQHSDRAIIKRPGENGYTAFTGRERNYTWRQHFGLGLASVAIAALALALQATSAILMTIYLWGPIPYGSSVEEMLYQTLNFLPEIGSYCAWAAIILAGLGNLQTKKSKKWCLLGMTGGMAWFLIQILLSYLLSLLP